jgi:hypothetical protein
MPDDDNIQDNEKSKEPIKVFIVGAPDMSAIFTAALAAHNLDVIVVERPELMDGPSYSDDDTLRLEDFGIEDRVFYLRNHHLDNMPVICTEDYSYLNKELSFNQSRVECIKMPNKQRQYLNKWQPK